jgi:MinD superfamily P-loop ATPase
MKSIVVLSGKGGVGKSSISASIAVLLAKEKRIICADCDVDASNLSLLFGHTQEGYESWEPISTNQKAVIDSTKCISCGKCIDICYFNALEIKKSIPEVKTISCEGCGACMLICPEKAISLQDVENAHIGYCITRYGFPIVSAQLMPGSSGSGKVVSKVKEKARSLAISQNTSVDILLIDAAAGIGCPVIASVSGAQHALLVTEPTPSGFSDLKKALSVINHFKIKHGLVINKYDTNEKVTKTIESFADSQSIPILAKIPFDKSFAHAMVNMIPVVDYNPHMKIIFENLKDKIIQEVF